MMTRSRSHAHRTPGTVLALLGALACLALLPAGAAAKQKQKPAEPLYWGAQIGNQYTGTQPPWDMSALDQFETVAGKSVSLLAFYSPFADCTVSPCEFYGFPAVPAQQIREHGAIPFLSWSSSSTDKELVRQPNFRLSAIIEGRYDEFIESFAENAREWGHPFFLRFDWEMNGFWFPWNEDVNGNKPGQYVAAWRHVHDIFTRMGANNATWVWCPNIALVNRLKGLGKYYPGDEYVDWTCLDGFNWGNTQYSAGWMNFERVFRSTYKEVNKIAPSKPMIIGETASEERGGSKANWIKNALHVIPKKFRKVRGLIYFNEQWQGMHWPIESSKSARNAFAKGIRHSVYRPNIYGGLVNGKIQPPTWGPPPTEPVIGPPAPTS